MRYRLEDWPLGLNEDDDGSYPEVREYGELDDAAEAVIDLLGDYTASAALTSGPAAILDDYVRAAADFGAWERVMRENADLPTEHRSYPDWKFQTGLEAISVTATPTKED